MAQSHFLDLADIFQKNESCLLANSRMPGSGSFLRSLKASGEKGQVRGDPGLEMTLCFQLQFHLDRRLRGLFPSIDQHGVPWWGGGSVPPCEAGMLQEAGRYGDRSKVWATYWRITT